jgi:hypothetical protein
MTLRRGVTAAIAAIVIAAAPGQAAAAAPLGPEATAAPSPRLVVFEEFSRPT